MTMKLNRDAYEDLIAGNLAWLETCRLSVEREHIKQIVAASADHEYGRPQVKWEGLTRERDELRAKLAEAEARALRAEADAAQLRAALVAYHRPAHSLPYRQWSPEQHKAGDALDSPTAGAELLQAVKLAHEALTLSEEWTATEYRAKALAALARWVPKEGT